MDQATHLEWRGDTGETMTDAELEYLDDMEATKQLEATEIKKEFQNYYEQGLVTKDEEERLEARLRGEYAI